MANSLVGAMIKVPKPSNSVHLDLYNFSITGIKNAKVLPEPVLAAAKTSSPFNEMGMDSF